MADELIALSASLNAALAALIDERDAALANGDMSAVNVAEKEAEELGTLLATVQFTLNNSLTLDLNALADRLEESIVAQRAASLSQAAGILAELVKKLGGPSGETTQGQKGDLKAKPGANQKVIDAIIKGARSNSLNPLTVLTIAAIESDFKLDAANPKSSAGGLFQFLDSTWTNLGGKKFPGSGGKGNGHAAAAPLADQIRIGMAFIAENKKKLKKVVNSEPTATMIYMAHQQGLAGATKILRASIADLIEDVIGKTQARLNGMAGQTVAQAMEHFRNLVRSRQDRVKTLVDFKNVTSDVAASASTERSVATKAANRALSELELFARHNGRIITETESPLRERVLEYFRFVGRGDVQDPSDVPWSAAFISFVIHQAGASVSQFPKSANHANYILTGLRNRLNDDLDAALVYYDRDEYAPQIGDLIGRGREGSVFNRDDIAKFLDKPKDKQFFPSHTDLVVATGPGSLTVIGGNVSQTIKTKEIPTNSKGKIKSSSPFFFSLKLNI